MAFLHLRILVLLILVCSLGKAVGQESLASLEYSGERLEYVLNDLSRRYQVRFAFSRNFIPVDQPIVLRVQQASLTETLDLLFAGLPVKYRRVSQQIVLQRDLDQLTQTSPPQEVRQQSPLYSEPRLEAVKLERRQRWLDNLPELYRRSIEPLPPGVVRTSAPEASPIPPYPVLEVALQDPAPRVAADDYVVIEPGTAGLKAAGNNRLAQVSLLPFLGTNFLNSYRMTNNVSFNLLWGTNGGVNGLEVGGLANTIRGDVKGIQIAGLVNVVGDDVVGSQISGVANIVRDTVMGVQVSGLFNRGGTVSAVQSAGLFNIATGNLGGVQAATLFNYAGGHANAIQAAALFNIAGGDAKAQGAFLFNRARDVEFGQISLLLNAAKTVDGFQVGLINVADTVTGIPIGLLNFVKKGYNKVEVAWSDALYANISLKIGVKRFYNILYLGGRLDDEAAPNRESVNILTWGLGYGIGTAITVSPRMLINLEALSIHVNEKEEWTNTLNLLNQFRILIDGKIGRHASLFAGPVGNLMVSRLVDPETGEIGSAIAPYTIYDETRNTTNIRGWVGFSAGIRF